MHESKLQSFLWLRFRFVIFGAQILCEKGARKMLMKLTTIVSDNNKLLILVNGLFYVVKVNSKPHFGL